MKIRRSIVLFISIVAVLVALALWHGIKRPVETSPVSVEMNTAQPVTTATGASMSSMVQSNAPPKMATAAAVSTSSQAERAVGILSTYNDVPIDFYGKVEDQSGAAVVGVVINFSVRIINGYESAIKNGRVVSDANGLFSILGYKGQDLSVVPQKAGYVSTMTSTLYKYSRLESHPYVSDPNNPVVIKMWKLNGAEPEALMSINQHYKFGYTGAPIYFDLLAGQIVPSGGDLEISVNRPDGIISQQHPQNWSIQLEAIGGGFIATSFTESRVTYSAPESGYETSGVFANNNGPGLVDQTFFLESRNGQVFSKFRLLFGINDTPDALLDVTFSGVANTNGSGNWEATAPQQ